MEKSISNYRKVSLTTRWKEIILNYLGKECVYCKSKKNLNLHHIIPNSKGGRDVMSNIEVLCNPCHRKIHKMINIYLPKYKKCK